MGMRYVSIAVLVAFAGVAGYLISDQRRVPLPEYTGDMTALDCLSAKGKTEKMPTTKLYFEYNSTDEDTGVHGAFDTNSFAELCVYDPSGGLILAVKPQGTFRDLAMGGIFFESREPTHREVSIRKHEKDFPEGLYSIKAISHDGTSLTGAAKLTHVIPAPAVITAPADDVTIPLQNLTVRWDPVTESTKGDPVTITGYEVIVTKENNDDPHGFSKPTYDVHVPPSVTSLTVPKEFFESDTEYELEVLALEASGNQTITVQFFRTAK